MLYRCVPVVVSRHVGELLENGMKMDGPAGELGAWVLRPKRLQRYEKQMLFHLDIYNIRITEAYS